MKLINSIKWAIAAAVTVATVAATVSIANAHSITPDTASRQTINIINNSNCHFELAENDAIKQARSFKLNEEIKDYSLSAEATLEYGSYDSNGTEVKLVKNEVFTGGTSVPSTPTEPKNTYIGGSEKSWSDVAADLSKLAIGSEVTIKHNGNTTVPFEVIKVIDDRQLKVTFIVDSVKSWKTDGAVIKTPAAADFTCILTASQKNNGLRGDEGIQFTMNNTNILSDLEIEFKAEHAGKFANLYKNVDGKLTFVTCAKVGADGKAILPDVTEKGDYVAMLCDFSDRPGDMDNNGVLNALDAAAILKDIVGLAEGANPLMADFNGNGRSNALDAAAVLKRIVGLA